MNETLIGLINNAALLLGLGVFYDLINLDPQLNTRVMKVVTGLLISVIAITVMLTPWQFQPGVNFDTRSILLSTTGLFFGFIPSAIAGTSTVLFRLYQGGDGAWTGVSVQVASVVIGLLWRYNRHRWIRVLPEWLELYIFGVIVHIVMLLCMLTLPEAIRADVIAVIAFPVMAIYPVGAVLLGKILSRQRLRREAENRIRENEERVRSIVNAITMPVAVTGYTDGAMLYSNSAFRELVGIDRQSLQFLSSADYLSPEDLAAIRNELRTHGMVDSREVQVKRGDGKLSWVIMSSRLLTFDNRSAVFTFIHDITVRKQMEDSLRESEERFRRAIEAAPLPLMIHSSSGDVVIINDAWTEITGYKHEDIPTTAVWAEKAYGDDKPRVMNVIESLFKLDGKFHEGEFVIQTRNGEKRNWDFSTSFLGHTPAGEGLVLSMAVDITERKNAQKERERLIAELESRNAELSRFTYTVSHDLKSPLVTIEGFLGLLEQDIQAGDTTRVTSDIDTIRSAGKKMGFLLDDLLKLSRIGRVVNPPENISFHEIAENAVGMTSGQLTKHGVQVRIEPDLPDVYGDPMRLEEVMQNLIVNAVKFMGDQPEPVIQIGVRNDGAVPVFFVRDNGIGIDPRFHNEIFDLFRRLSTDDDGTGIGLALVKRIIEFHHGRIWVESEGIGKGSTFCFTLNETQGD